jgi:hypothetical protein
MRRMEQSRALMLGVVALVMTTAACSSPGTKATPPPGPTSSVTTTPPAAVHVFVSKRYGFRLTLGTDWTGTDAEAAWDGKALQGVDSPAFADFADATGRAFTVGAAPVTKGTQLAAWRAAMVRGRRPGCVDSRSVKKTTLGGEPALAWTTNCGEGSRINKIAAVHGTRGYMTIFELSPANVTAADQRILESIRQSFRFSG